MKLPEGFLDIFYASELLSLHPKARNEHGSKVIDATPETGYLCYGQYREGYPVKPLQAVFEISIEDNSKNDQACLVLDVYNHHNDRVLAKKGAGSVWLSSQETLTGVLDTAACPLTL